jgi:[acyl-carrier-protein] S-malonyltransferase
MAVTGMSTATVASLAFVFPGQGSQRIGMLAAAYAGSAVVREALAEAADALGFDLWGLISSGDQAALNLTETTQPALLACSVALWRDWCARGGPTPALMAGHSLGEFSALCCAGALDYADALRLVRQRGAFMQSAVPVGEGAMAAVIGLEPDKLEELVKPIVAEGPLALANFNTPEQTVISGTKELVSKAGDAAKAAGARVVPLKVSGAWHSPLMADAGPDFAAFLATLSFQPPTLPIYLNATAAPETDPERLRQAMSRQLTSPVRWADLILNLKNTGVDLWVEVGPKNVLKGLVRKILPQEPPENFWNVENQASLEGFLADLPKT